MFYEFHHPMTADYFKMQSTDDLNFPAHLHYCFEFVTITRGEMDIFIDGRRYVLEEGGSILIFPNQVHSLVTRNTSKHILCLFSPMLVSAFSSRVSGKIPLDNRFSPDPFYTRKLSELLDDTDRLALKGFLYSLAAEFDSGAEYVPQTNENLLAGRIFRFVEDNYSSDCSLNALAKNIGYDYSYLSAYFKKTVGVSYNDYVNQYRIGKVCYLLANCEKNVLDISAECGFNSLRSLNRNFRESIGRTPTEYRRASKEGITAKKESTPKEILC